MNPNPDEAREFFARKSLAMTDKRMTEKEAVDRFIPDDGRRKKIVCSKKASFS
jgi:hypothetical protein